MQPFISFKFVSTFLCHCVNNSSSLPQQYIGLLGGNYVSSDSWNNVCPPKTDNTVKRPYINEEIKPNRNNFDFFSSYGCKWSQHSRQFRPPCPWARQKINRSLNRMVGKRNRIEYSLLKKVLPIRRRKQLVIYVFKNCGNTNIRGVRRCGVYKM